jgi:mercuric ion transport protein
LTQNRLLATGIIGFGVSMLGCVTPGLVALLAALGISGSMGWLDYILLPAMAIFAGLTGYALVCRSRRHGLPPVNR